MTTATLAMFTPGNTIIILVILLLMFGAKKLPELARGLGQAIKEFSKAKNEIHDEILRDPAPTSQTAYQQPPQIDQPMQTQQPAGTYAQSGQAVPPPAATVPPTATVPPVEPAKQA